MFGALASLLFLGRLTDRFGFVAVLRAGLILMTLGVLASTVAWNVPSFALGRVVIGVASGLITTSASVGMTRLNNRGDLQRAAATTSLTIAFGFGLGPVVGGLIAQWLPWPLVTAYIPSLGLGLLAVYALYQVRIAEPAELASTQARALHWRDFMPTITLPERRFARHYALGGMCVLRLRHVQPVRIAGAQLHAAHGALAWAGRFGPVHRRDPVPLGGLPVPGAPAPDQGLGHSGLCLPGGLQPPAAGQQLCGLGLAVRAQRDRHGGGPRPVQPGGHVHRQQGLDTGHAHGPAVHVPGGRLPGHHRAHPRPGLAPDHIGITEALVAYCIVMGALAGWLCWMCTRTPTLPMPKH